jgi:hypothetical protein
MLITTYNHKYAHTIVETLQDLFEPGVPASVLGVLQSAMPLVSQVVTASQPLKTATETSSARGGMATLGMRVCAVCVCVCV